MKPELGGDRDAAALEELLPLLVDARLGIIETVREIPIEPGEPAFVHYAARACDASAFAERANFRNSGGAAVRRERALAKAVGEAVERYCAALYEREALPLAAAAEADFACAPPQEFALYTQAQYAEPGFPWAPFDAFTRVRWTPAIDLESGQQVFVPAAMVWIPYAYVQGSGDAPIVQPISTGLACHLSWERAALSGLLEVIERDSFTIIWQRMVAPPRIRVETLDDVGYDMVRRFERTGDRVHLFDITLDSGIPTHLAVLESSSRERPAYVFAAAAHLDAAEASRRALEELAHTRRYSQRIHLDMPPVEADGVFEHVREQADHLGFAANHENRSFFDFLFRSRARLEADELPRLATGDPGRDLDRATERVLATGHRVLVADLTSEDVAPLGLRVVRVVVPGYHPLFMGYRWRARGGRRLHEVPQRLGLEAFAPEGADNPAPHPYP